MQAPTPPPNSETTRVNVALLPGGELLQLQLKLAAKIAGNRSVKFFIDNVSHWAHMSVYPLTLPTRNWRNVLAIVRDVAYRTSPIPLHFANYYCGDHWNDVGIAFQRTGELLVLQERLAEALSSQREGLYPAFYDRQIESGRIGGKKADYVRRYGTPNIYRYWEPHLTLALFNDRTDGVIAERWLHSQAVPFTKTKELAIVETDELGTCTGIIQSFPLGRF